jgi:hypothetical protein
MENGRSLIANNSVITGVSYVQLMPLQIAALYAPNSRLPAADRDR